MDANREFTSRVPGLRLIVHQTSGDRNRTLYTRRHAIEEFPSPSDRSRGLDKITSERRKTVTQIRDFEELNEEQLKHEQVEKRAYKIYQQHNGESGHELEDWFIAEEEVRQQKSKRESQRMKL
jgi:hypothetical protein